MSLRGIEGLSEKVHLRCYSDSTSRLQFPASLSVSRRSNPPMLKASPRRRKKTVMRGKWEYRIDCSILFFIVTTSSGVNNYGCRRQILYILRISMDCTFNTVMCPTGRCGTAPALLPLRVNQRRTTACTPLPNTTRL